ncbi:MAG: hypothetical protein K8S56_01345, partial [Candidatus Cloacimonetes bacterium]|nr:hypothetical protein [Candidatus Cloacimonadota bacterium]
GLSGQYYYARVTANAVPDYRYSNTLQIQLAQTVDNSVSSGILIAPAVDGSYAIEVEFLAGTPNPGATGIAVYENTVHPNLIPGYEANTIQRYCNVTPAANNGSLLAFISLYYSNAECLSLDENMLYPYRYHSGQWYRMPDGIVTRHPADNKVRILGIATFSDFVLIDETSGQMPISNTIYTNIKVYLQGAWDATDNDLVTNINPDIPLTSPYDASISVTEMPASAVDWVQVQIRSLPNSANVAEESMLLLSDGTIQDSDGGVPGVVAPDGSYYIVVLHRNHLGVMSLIAHSFVPDAYTTNLADLTLSNACYNDGAPNTGVIEVDTGVFAMIAGETTDSGTANGTITDPDKAVINTTNGSTGYQLGDTNFSGTVTDSDKAFINVNNGKSCLVPQESISRSGGGRGRRSSRRSR